MPHGEPCNKAARFHPTGWQACHTVHTIVLTAVPSVPPGGAWHVCVCVEGCVCGPGVWLLQQHTKHSACTGGPPYGVLQHSLLSTIQLYTQAHSQVTTHLLHHSLSAAGSASTSYAQIHYLTHRTYLPRSKIRVLIAVGELMRASLRLLCRKHAVPVT